MSLSNLQIGGWSVLGGVARFDGWWGKALFVDYDDGASEGNSGLEPSSAYKYLQDAINAALINDVIYVRNREQDVTSTDPETITPESTTNWTVAEAQTHLSIIGASNTSHIPSHAGHMGVVLKGSTSTSEVMNWKGAFGLIENLAFAPGSSTSGLLKLHGNSTSLRAANTVINNCLFRKDASGPSLYNLDNWWVAVYNSSFHDCLTGIKMHGSSSTVRRIMIDGCKFINQVAAEAGQNILISGSSTAGVWILNSYFGIVPTGSGAKFINFDAAATGLIANCFIGGDTNTFTQYCTNNGVKVVGCHDTGENTEVIKDS